MILNLNPVLCQRPKHPTKYESLEAFSNSFSHSIFTKFQKHRGQLDNSVNFMSEGLFVLICMFGQSP